MSLFWKSAHGRQRGYVEGYEPGYGRFAAIDRRGVRLVVFQPADALKILTIKPKGAWCAAHVARMLEERV